MVTQRRLRVLQSPTEERWMQTAIKVGFATADMKRVDQHFGVAESFAIFSVDSERSVLLEVVQFGSAAMDGHEDKLGPKIAALTGCVAVYMRAAGASAIGQLRSHGIRPIKVSADVPVTELLRGLQLELRNGPSVWLKRAIEAQKPAYPDRFAHMDAEGWEE